MALFTFAIGAGVSIYQGIGHVRQPVSMTSPAVNYIVLGLAMVFEAGSWWVAFKEFREAKGQFGYIEAVRQSKDPASFMVLVEDSAALLGLVVALAGTVAAEVFQLPILDGVASIAIGILLGVVALFLARECKALLIGETARSDIVAAICRMARAQPGIEHSNALLTVHLGPRQIVVAISVDLADELLARDVEAIVAALEDQITKVYPEVVAVLIKPQSLAAFRRSDPRRCPAGS